MCGRFTLRAPASTIAEQFALFEQEPFQSGLASLRPRFNIAPTQAVAAVRVQSEAQPPQRQLAWLRWGLIPSWAQDRAIGNRLINARAETAAQKPAFRTALARRRCLVVADGFYEWQKVGPAKRPWFFHLRDDRPFGFAGLWESWEGPDHSQVESCTLLTTVANDLVRTIHDRMPVILPAEHYGLWLDPAVRQAGQVAPLLGPFPADLMEAVAISPYVNNPANDDPRCVQTL